LERPYFYEGWNEGNKKTWNSNEDTFLTLREEKDIPYIVDCVQECFDSLTPKEKEMVMSI
jgi:hypothetical protein